MRFQLSLRWALIGITLIAALLGGWKWYQWWEATKHMRKLHAAIVASSLSAEDKTLLGHLACSARAWETGLIDELVESPAIKRIVWTSTISCDGHKRRIFLLDSFVRPTAGADFPITCVVTTEQLNLIDWYSLAPFSRGFIGATLATDGTLVITTVCSWFHGKGVHTYLVSGCRIVPVSHPRFSAFDLSDVKTSIPRLHSDGERLRNAATETRTREGARPTGRWLREGQSGMSGI
jgi:hypothetical protein